MKIFKCLIVDSMHESIVEMLSSDNIQINYLPFITKEEILTIINEYDGIIIRSKLAINKVFLEKAINLKFVARAGAGIDQIDIEEVAKRNIEVINAPEGNRDAVGEHTIGMLLALFNKFQKSDVEIRNGIWDREGNRGFEIKGKTIAIIGYGNMGQSFAKRLSAFDCEVLAYDKYRQNYSDQFAKEANMDEIFQKSDVISFHIPLTPETKGMVDKNFMEKFTKNIWILNTARGEIVILNDLVKALETNKVIGAGLDVLENEKINKLSESELAVFNQLKKMDNILFTPHVAGWSFESYKRINEVLKNKILDFIGTHTS